MAEKVVGFVTCNAHRNSVLVFRRHLPLQPFPIIAHQYHGGTAVSHSPKPEFPSHKLNNNKALAADCEWQLPLSL